MQIAETVTVINTPAASSNLVDLAVVKDDLNIKTGDGDRFLKRAIARASQAAAKYCNRTFVVETVTDTFYSARQRTSHQRLPIDQILQLTRWPLIAITSLLETAGDGTQTALTAATDYTVRDANVAQLVRLDSDTGFPAPWCAPETAVQYSAGYNTIPDDLQDAVSRMVAARWNARGRDPYLAEQNLPGVIEQRWWVPSAGQVLLPPDIRELLDAYRVPIAA